MIVCMFCNGEGHLVEYVITIIATDNHLSFKLPALSRYTHGFCYSVH